MSKRNIVPGTYRHFKGKQYLVHFQAQHTETGETMVVYQALYGKRELYVRPLEMFASPVDKVKYPDAIQDWRFQREDEESCVALACEYNTDGICYCCDDHRDASKGYDCTSYILGD